MTTDQSNPITVKIIQRDLTEIKQMTDKSTIIFAEPIDDNPFHIEAAILGPEQTAYENGLFVLNIKLSQNYPVSKLINISNKERFLYYSILHRHQLFSNEQQCIQMLMNVVYSCLIS